MIFLEDKYADFVQIYKISTFTVIQLTKDFSGGFIFTRCDDRFVLRRQSTNQLHVPEFRECSRVDQELHEKLLFTRSQCQFPRGSAMEIIQFINKSMLKDFIKSQQSRHKYFLLVM